MNTTLKITKIGNSAAVILTKEVLAQLRAEVGDTIHLTQSPEGWHLTPYDPAFEKQMAPPNKSCAKIATSSRFWPSKRRVR